MTKDQFLQDFHKESDFVTVKATLLQDTLKQNLQYERLLKHRDEEIRRLKILYRDWETDRKSTRLNSSHITRSRMPSSA